MLSLEKLLEFLKEVSWESFSGVVNNSSLPAEVLALWILRKTVVKDGAWH